MSIESIKKAKHVWTSPLTGNAVVILADSLPSPRGQIRVVIGDLDMGERFVVQLSDLKHQIRTADESDFYYSWTCDHDEDIEDYIIAGITVPDTRTVHP